MLSAGLFDLFHVLNIITGAAIMDTLFQATHAAAMGFLYASLRLRIGMIWLLILLYVCVGSLSAGSRVGYLRQTQWLDDYLFSFVVLLVAIFKSHPASPATKL